MERYLDLSETWRRQAPERKAKFLEVVSAVIVLPREFLLIHKPFIHIRLREKSNYFDATTWRGRLKSWPPSDYTP